MSDGDLLGNIRFVKLVTVSDLLYAEAIQKALRSERIGAIIINDEAYQGRPDPVRAQAMPPPEGFRIEVPEPMLAKARKALAAIQRAEDAS